MIKTIDRIRLRCGGMENWKWGALGIIWGLIKLFTAFVIVGVTVVLILIRWIDNYTFIIPVSAH